MDRCDARKVNVISRDDREAPTFVFKFGIPDNVVSDNGTSLSSREFKQWHCTHLSGTLPPIYHWPSRKSGTNCQTRDTEPD